MNGWARIRAAGVLFEDHAALVLDKPAGVAVTGERHDDDLVSLAAAAGEFIAPAHRIDKVTSGAVLLARSMPVHGALTRQFAAGTVTKSYLAVTSAAGLPAHGTIDLPLSTGRKSRVRIAADRARITAERTADQMGGRWSVPQAAVFSRVTSYPSVSEFDTLWQDDRLALLAVSPHTGRRHQIRVHLAWIGHPIVGDPLFARPTGVAVPRTALHSWRLGFDAPWLDRRVTVTAPPGEDFWGPLAGRLDVAEREAALRAWASRQAPAPLPAGSHRREPAGAGQ